MDSGWSLKKLAAHRLVGHLPAIFERHRGRLGEDPTAGFGAWSAIRVDAEVVRDIALAAVVPDTRIGGPAFILRRRHFSPTTGELRVKTW
jgi:hypothetical protein